MSIPRGMSGGVAQRYRGMPGANPVPQSTEGMEQPFSEDDLASALGAMAGVPLPAGGGAGMSAGMGGRGLLQALRARLQGAPRTGARDPFNAGVPSSWDAPGASAPPPPMAPMGRTEIMPQRGPGPMPAAQPVTARDYPAAARRMAMNESPGWGDVEAAYQNYGKPPPSMGGWKPEKQKPWNELGMTPQMRRLPDEVTPGDEAFMQRHGLGGGSKLSTTSTWDNPAYREYTPSTVDAQNLNMIRALAAHPGGPPGRMEFFRRNSPQIPTGGYGGGFGLRMGPTGTYIQGARNNDALSPVARTTRQGMLKTDVGPPELARRMDARDAGLLTPSEVYAPRPAPMQRTPVPPPGMSSTGVMDDLPPLPPADPNVSKRAGFPYRGPDQAELARRYDDEWWANHAANPPPKMGTTAADLERMDPLAPLPPADPDFIRAFMRSRQKTGR